MELFVIPQEIHHAIVQVELMEIPIPIAHCQVSNYADLDLVVYGVNFLFYLYSWFWVYFWQENELFLQPNSDCYVTNGQEVCRCKSGFDGQAYDGCQPGLNPCVPCKKTLNMF